MTFANASEGADRSRKVIGEASGSQAQTGTRRRPLGDGGFTQGRRGVRRERPEKSRLTRRKEHLDQSSIFTLFLISLRRQTLLLLFAMGFIQAALLMGVTTQGLADAGCVAARKQLEREQQRLTEYLLALQASYDGQDFKLAEVLNHKIVQLRRELDVLKGQVAECTGGNPAGPEGLSSAKTEDAQVATKSCGELRKSVLPLLRKVRSLKRREKSVLSALTPDEEAELADASEQLREINGALKARCAVPESRTTLMKKLRK